jgi:TetR/AcrR family transcriptional regulator
MTRTSGRATKAKIVDVALKLFGSQGYDATSLDGVAAVVGVRKQTLLYYFASKADLFAAAAAEAATALYVNLEGALRDHDPGGLDRIPVFIESAMALAKERPEALNLIREVARAGPPVSDRVVEALRPLLDSAVAWFERGMDDGVIRRQHPRIALLTIYSAVMGHLTESSVTDALLDDDARQRAGDEISAFLRAALEPQ